MEQKTAISVCILQISHFNLSYIMKIFIFLQLIYSLFKFIIDSHKFGILYDLNDGGVIVVWHPR